MSKRLWSDILSGSGRRFWFALDSSPGFVSPSPAVLTLAGLQATEVEPATVFRTPATAQISIGALAPGSFPTLMPSPASLSMDGAAPSKQTTLIITPAIFPDYNDLPGLAPTIVFVQTITPAPAQLGIVAVEINVSPGGNIGYVSPAVAQLAAIGSLSSFVFHVINQGQVTVNGLQPSLLRELILTPGVAALSQFGPIPFVDKSFTWVDIDPSPPLVWIREDNVLS